MNNNKMKVLAKLKPELGIWDSISEIPKIGVGDVLIKIKKYTFITLFLLK